MSLYDYQRSKALEAADEPFCGLIMAAMRRADTVNLAILQSVYPQVWQELLDRYNAPGALLPADPGYAAVQEERARVFGDTDPLKPGDYLSVDVTDA